ncbi:MAG: 6-carboxytetrahydropterin synthase QueD [Spirochaetes bacterium]|nr:6-carboxytetrahydropterin synthase QueD [Spirochaetota bacterium]
MYQLSVEESFASAHQLRGYKGKCEKLHGHNWRVILTVRGDSLDSVGLLVDFGELKAIVRKICAVFDHQFLNEIPPFTDINPSSENLARIIATMAAQEIGLLGRDICVESVTIYESENSKCTYLSERNDKKS